MEADGLNPTKIHCLVYEKDGKYVALTSSDDMRDFLNNEQVLIGHNIIRFDIPVLERLLGIRISAKLIDTLALSWYLEPELPRHGLEEWGEYFGVPKPPIEDWFNLPVEEYVHRCTEDVKINVRLWRKFKKHLLQLYGSKDGADKLIQYLTFKMDCAREQERSRWKLDREKCNRAIATLEREQTEKLEALRKAMPSIPIYKNRKRPTKPYKKDGTLSASGTRWQELLKLHSLGNDYDQDIQELVGQDEPNPASPAQLKEWLFSLGWKPATFKYLRDKNTGDIRKIPQINLEHGAGVCPSVKHLYPIEPAVENISNLGVIQHRLALLKGFLSSVDDDGYIRAEIGGLTNTLRFKHRVIVNLPKANNPYAEDIRGSLIAPDGYELCGSDMSSLEDRLKQHYIYPYDPDYVNEMNVPGYDPHLALALLGGEVTELQIEEYKSGANKSIKPIRDIFKNGNYACQYGAGPERLALTANISVKKAKQVWEIYWQKNWAIKEAAAAQEWKRVNGQMWLLNPISQLWYSLRYEKDIFSTLVQGSASYVFDLWVQKFRLHRTQLTAQFHDEVVLCVKLGHREDAIRLLRAAIDEANNELKLNRQLDIDIQFGNNYAEIH